LQFQSLRCAWRLTHLSRPGDFREAALAAAAGPLNSESRGVICDLLIDAGEIDAAVTMLERWMRPGQPPDPGVA